MGKMKNKSLFFTLILIFSILFCLSIVFTNGFTKAEELEGDEHGEHLGWQTLTVSGGEIESGSYYLSEDIILENNLIINGEVTLCLNGYMLVGNGNGAVISISGGTLNLMDCNGSNNSHQYYVDEDLNEVFVFNKGQEGWETAYQNASEKGEILGGVVTGGNESSNGGGIFAGNGSTFVMESGTIAGNSCPSGIGGGVGVDNSTFILNGGLITGNYAGNGGGFRLYKCIFNMNGGSIVNNVGNYGGGITVDNCSVIMNDGVISNNKAGYGGGLEIFSSGVFNLYGGIITQNESLYCEGGEGVSSSSGGAWVWSGILNVYGGTICDNQYNGELSGVLARYGGTVNVYGGNFDYISTYAGGTHVNISGGHFASADVETNQVFGFNVLSDYQVIQCMPNGDYPYLVVSNSAHNCKNGTFDNVITATTNAISGGDSEENIVNYYLVCDVTLIDNIEINGYVAICLNGYQLVGNSNGSVITLSKGANLTLYDCPSATNLVNNDFVSFSGTITGGNAENGGAVFVGDDAILTINGGILTDNVATYGNEIYVDTNAILNIDYGYFEKDDIYNNGGIINITGGYFADANLLSEYIPTGYKLVYTDESNGDNDFVQGYNYAVYLVVETQNYQVSAADITYGNVIEPIVEGNTFEVQVTYSYTINNQEIEGLPSDAGSYKINAKFDEYVDGKNKVYYSPITVQFEVDIEKAIPSFTKPTDLTAKEGQKLKDVSLSEGWSWEDPSLSVGKEGENTFVAIYTPEDVNNYETVSVELTIKVEPNNTIWIVVACIAGIAVLGAVIGCIFFIRKRKVTL